MNTDERSKQRVTIKEVAQAAGVSIATVSYVLNNKPGQSISEETRKKVLQFANMLGYECNIMARYLKKGIANVVAVVIKERDGASAQYYLKMLTELSRLLSRHDLMLKISDYDEELAKNVDTCSAYVTVALSEKEFRAFADTKYSPVIAVDSRFNDYLFYRVNDDYELMYSAAKTELGRDKISLLTYPLPPECMQAAQSVFDGIKVISNLNDIALDGNSGYATTCKALRDVRPKDIYLHDASFALKASAAAEAVVKAINRVQSSVEEHDVTV